MIGGALFGAGINEFFSLSTWLLAIGGAIIVLLVYGMITSAQPAKADADRKPVLGLSRGRFFGTAAPRFTFTPY